MKKYRCRLEIMQAILEACECDLGAQSIQTQATTSSKSFKVHMEEMKRLSLVTELPKKKVRLFKVTKKGKKFLEYMCEIKKLELAS